MARSRFRSSGPPKRLAALFLAITALPAAALVWAGWLLVRDYGELADKQLRDRLETAATAIAAEIARDLDGLDSPDLPLSINAGAMALVLGDSEVVSHRGAPLIVVPVAAPAREAPPATWSDAETLEFAREYEAAQAIYRQLAASADPRVRAGASIRLARTLRVAGERGQALQLWRDLAASRDLDHVIALEWPVTLQAGLAAVRLLADTERPDERARMAADIRADLLRGRWRVDRLTFDTAWHAVGETAIVEAAADAVAFAEAIEHLYRDWRGVGLAARGVRITPGTPRLLLHWRAEPERLHVLAAEPGFFEARWRPYWQTRGVDAALEQADGSRPIEVGPPVAPVASRSPGDTGLPWTLHVWSTSPDRERAALARPRRLVIVVLSLAAFLVIAGAYFVGRGLARELEVARLQSEFVSAVSHEFRTPLTSMSHLVELLRGRPDMDASRRGRYYDALEQETDRLRRFVDQLLDFGRVHAGAAQYRLDPIAPAALVSRLVDAFRSTPAATGRAITCTANGALPDVLVDADAMALAINNLLDNAAKYSPPDAPIAVDVANVPGSRRVLIHVRDEGAGVAAGEREAIFQKFVRGAAAQQSGAKGTGVGLALAREIVRAHGGDISVESAPERGCIFTIALPTAVPANVPHAPALGVPSSRS